MYQVASAGIPHPYLTENADLSIAEEEPMPRETWNGLSAQNRYAIARQDLLVRLGPYCQVCRQQFSSEDLQAHHIQSQREGGKHGASNIQLLCHDCHTKTESYGKSQKM
jgi:5-methylcytosine-specific restriction endonuclease McrA